MGADGMEGATRSTIPASGIIPAPFLSHCAAGNDHTLRGTKRAGVPFPRCGLFHMPLLLIRTDYASRVVVLSVLLQVAVFVLSSSPLYRDALAGIFQPL